MEYKDPIEVSPENYRLLLEDGNHRMIEMWLPAGTTDIEHSLTIGRLLARRLAGR